MATSLRGAVRDQGRGVVGGLIVGTPLIYTMETWWLAWTLPAWLLALFAAIGLVVVAVVVHFVGFRPEHEGPGSLRDLAEDLGDIVLQSVLASVIILLLLGVHAPSRSWHELARLALIQLVPVGLGAAVADRMLRAGDEDDRVSFGKEMATFALGALIFMLPIAPTEEIEMIAAQAGWWRSLLLGLATVGLTLLALHELEFRGQRGRSAVFATWPLRAGETCTGYVLALGLCALVLAGYGHFIGATFPEAIQQVVVLGMPASIGGAAARVII